MKTVIVMLSLILLSPTTEARSLADFLLHGANPPPCRTTDCCAPTHHQQQQSRYQERAQEVDVLKQERRIQKIEQRQRMRWLLDD